MKPFSYMSTAKAVALLSMLPFPFFVTADGIATTLKVVMKCQ
jgi:hypothetical protein